MFPKLVLFFEYFFMNQTFKYKMALLRQAKTFILFWKNVLQGVLKRVPPVPNSKKLTNGAFFAKRKLLCKIKFFFWGKFSLRISYQNWCCFFKYFFMNQTFKYKMALLRQAKTFIFFWKNVLQCLLRSVPVVPISKKLTNGAVLAKNKLLCQINFFFEENFL